MRVVGWQELCDAVTSVELATEWPHNSIFVYLAQYDAIMITRRDGFIHGDLFRILRRDWRERGNSDVDLEDRQIWTGIIEWENNGSHLAKTQSGPRLEPEIQREIDELIDKARRKIQ